jgi:uncharacterized protein YjbJ (UPF0337 family)
MTPGSPVAQRIFRASPHQKSEGLVDGQRASGMRFRGMNTTQLKGNWNEIKGKLKSKYANLTDDDLLFAEGKEDEMLGRLQQKLGRTKEELRDEIDKL